MRAKLTIENNEYFVEGLANQDSSLITELAKSDSLIVRPINSKRIPKGEKVKVIKFFHFDIWLKKRTSVEHIYILERGMNHAYS